MGTGKEEGGNQEGKDENQEVGEWEPGKRGTGSQEKRGWRPQQKGEERG